MIELSPLGQIHDFVRNGDASGLENYLRTIVDVVDLINEPDNGGYTPLLAALSAQVADPRIVRLLLEAGADNEYVRVQQSWGVDVEALESIGIQLPDIAQPTVPYSESTISAALKSGNLEIVNLFADRGADFHYVNPHGYNAILDATYAIRESTEVVNYLLSLGVSPNVKSSYGELPLITAMRLGRYRLASLLVLAGADETSMKWSPLIRAAALGTLEDVHGEITLGATVEARDSTGHSALHIALRRGHKGMTQALLESGASIEIRLPDNISCLHCAVEGGETSLIERMIDLGCSVDEKNYFDSTPLMIAAESGNHELVRLLLDRGASPSKGRSFDSIVSGAKDRQTILILLEAGADPAELDNEGRRKLVGLPEANDSALATVSIDQYRAACYVREGHSNPEDLTEPFRIAMVLAGCNAYQARSRFGNDSSYACSRTWKSRPPQVWCFERFGQSFTLMPDGRTIMVAGEHEDSYDPDFCIYNDVTVFYPDGQIKVFGYPYKVFEPTDFHTATLFGHTLWIVGGLGYPDQRKGNIPVYQLDVRDYSIKRVETSGHVPPRIYHHRANLVGRNIEVRGGTSITHKWKKECASDNPSVYQLNVDHLQWSLVKG